MKEKACRNCKGLTILDKCPYCGSTDLSNNWKGILIIIDPEKSEIAKKLGISLPGKYAMVVK